MNCVRETLENKNAEICGQSRPDIRHFREEQSFVFILIRHRDGCYSCDTLD